MVLGSQPGAEAGQPRLQRSAVLAARIATSPLMQPNRTDPNHRLGRPVEWRPFEDDEDVSHRVVMVVASSHLRATGKQTTVTL